MTRRCSRIDRCHPKIIKVTLICFSFLKTNPENDDRIEYRSNFRAIYRPESGTSRPKASLVTQAQKVEYDDDQFFRERFHTDLQKSKGLRLQSELNTNKTTRLVLKGYFIYSFSQTNE